MYNRSLINNNNENMEQQLSQEYSTQSYHEMQPASFISIPQSTIDISRRKLGFFSFYCR
jgi:hypothetical protein